MGTAPSSLRVHAEFRQHIRHWDILDVMAARTKYKLLTLRFCVNMEQLSVILGRQMPDPLVGLIFQVFAPKSIRVPPPIPVVDVIEVFVGLILVCQATLAQRVAFIFDLMDVQSTGRLGECDLSVRTSSISLLCAVARSIVKMTSPPYAVLPETVQKFGLAGLALEAKRVNTIDKPTFCHWALHNPIFDSYLRVCTGQDLPRLYVGLEKTNSFVGYIEFDSIAHMQSISVAGLRILAIQQMRSRLPLEFDFLGQGRRVDRLNETNVKGWTLIPFALLGTPGMAFHTKDADYQAKAAALVGTTSGPHPNQRPFPSFQFSHHHHVVESYAQKTRRVQPIHKHVQFRLDGPRLWWRPSQTWSGDWLVNQSRLGSHEKAGLKRKLKKLAVPTGLVVKDTAGRILSNNPTLQHMQSKLRLLAMDTQLAMTMNSSSHETKSSSMLHPDDATVLLVDLEQSRSHTRLLGTTNCPKIHPVPFGPQVVDAHVELPNSWSRVATSIRLHADEVQSFPVVWIRPLAIEPSPLDEIELSVATPSSLVVAVLQTLGDKQRINDQDVCGRTLLHHTAAFGHYRLLDALLAEHALVDVGDAQRNTALHLAAARGRLKEVSALLTNGASTIALNVHHQVPLLLALYGADRHKAKVKPTAMDVLTKYSTIHQVIDLLWDRTPATAWHVPDLYGVSIFQLEQAIFGDLFEAARAGLVARIQHLLESKKVADISTTMSTLQRTALHEACERGRYNACDYLVSQGIDVFCQDCRGATALHVATTRGYDKIVELVVHKYPKSTLLQDVNGNTALHLAIERRRVSIALYLIHHMAEIDMPNAFGATPLHVACLMGNLSIASVLLDAGANPTTNTYTRPVALSRRRRHLLGLFWKKGLGTPIVVESPIECLLLGWANDIHNATYLELFQRLLAMHAWPSIHVVDVTNTPLAHTLVARLATNPSVVVECLTELSTRQLLSVNGQDQHGNTLLLVECKRVCGAQDTSLAVVRCLVDLGANVHLPNHTKQLPLQCAAFHGHDALLDVLLETIPPDTLGRSTQAADSALHMACLAGHLSTVQRLLSRGAALNNCAGETPLCCAIRSGKADVVQYLLHRGADVNVWCPLSPRLTVFGQTFGLADATTAMGSPLTVVVQLASRTFQPQTNDLAPTHPEVLAENQHVYLSKAELGHRDRWHTWSRIATMLGEKLLQVDAALKIHVYATDVARACLLGFWAVASQLLTHRRIVFPRMCDVVVSKEAIHYAAAAGQTAVVAALVASGVNPNVKVQHILRASHIASARTARCVVGPLYFAYARGQLVTAATLHLLGASVETLPRHGSTIVLDGGWTAWMKLGYLQRKIHRPPRLFCQHANMVRHLEVATRLSVGLVHVACMRGSLDLLQLYCDAGLSLHEVTAVDGHTPLTLAIQAEHVHVVQWIVDHHVQALHVKARHVPLATACGLPRTSTAKQALVSLLMHHVSLNDVGGDGHTAVDRAALVGDDTTVDALLQANATPTVRTVVAALQGKSRAAVARLAASLVGLQCATFDHLLQLFILASSQQQWPLVAHVLALADAAIDPIATWIRRAASCCLILHRAAAANQVDVVRQLLATGVPPDLVVVEIPETRSPIWYAAIHGAVDTFLALVLHLPPQQSCLPAMQRKVPWTLNALSLPLHSIDSSDTVRLDGGAATCSWRNLSVMSCYQTPPTRALRLIHRCLQYWTALGQRQPHNQDNQTLMHLVAQHGDVATMLALVDAGAKLDVVNNQMQTPAMVAAQRSDASGTRLLASMWPRLTDDDKVRTCHSCTQSREINDASLAFCLQEPKYFKGMHYAPAIRAGHAHAIQLLRSANIPVECTVWQTLATVLHSKQGKRCRPMVESLLPVLDITVAVALVAEIAAAAAMLHWWPIVQHLLHLFSIPLTKALNQSKQTTRSVLHDAVLAGQHQVIQHLLQQGWELTQDGRGQTPLHVIAWIGDLSIMELFQRCLPSDKLTAALHAQDTKGRTVLHVAAMRGHLDVFDALQAAGANAETRAQDGWTAALVAAKHNQLQIVMRLVLQKPPATTLETPQHESITIVAAKYGAFRIVSWLLLTLNLTAGAVVGLASTDGKTLVHFAALFNQLPVLTANPCLLQAINTKDVYGCLPLHYALMAGRLEAIEYLCWNGASAAGLIQSPLLATETFDVAMVLQWSPLPGWFSHLLDDHPVKTTTTTPSHHAIDMRSWAFPQTTLLEFATTMGLTHTTMYLMGILRYLPQLCLGTVEVRQRIFMGAVGHNQVDAVDVLLSADVVEAADKPHHYFGDFVDIAVQHSARRGLEAMALCLLRHWKSRHASRPDESAMSLASSQLDFAVHFAVVLQHACIYGRLALIRDLVARGGASILHTRVDEGAALAYAFAFGQLGAVQLLLQLGADMGALDAYHAPSLKRWLEFQQPQHVQIEWSPHPPVALATKKRRRSFCGPVEEYDVVERLPREMLEAIVQSPRDNSVKDEA
ncbi:Aste57867_17464 [Aphanomyces stellatus]|uniref:Aste57867_17464 protein n=1 Tax=Aphanomyces stellatus TaxID=120398 RepID=A0A485L7S6_9STRA|nr:hypothetical protein As57867_017404 [Aphanomyces stellatus]VFT94218.1 Aste57867_17464 [Aphanomyces stellatus]